MQVAPIDLTSVIAVTLGTLIVLVPVAGLTARFAFKPIAEAVARFREAEGSDRQVAMLEQRVDLLEQQLAGMESDLRKLEDAREFHEELAAPEDRQDG